MPAPDVILRRWRPDDAGAIAAMTSDAHLLRWSSMGADVAGWIQRQITEARGPSRAICRARDDRALGKVALRLPGHASAATSCAAIRPDDAPVGELSYWIVPDARGQGLAGAAVRAMLAWASDHTDLRTVVLDIEPGNDASVALANRLGAERREPPRTERDRTGIERTLVVHVVGLPFAALP